MVTLFNAAIDQELLDRNPFRGLGQRTRGRSDERPPTVDELERLFDACSALGDYSEQMRALIVFGAYTGMRPSELFALEWSDIDLKANRIDVQRRALQGRVRPAEVKQGAAGSRSRPRPAMCCSGSRRGPSGSCS